MMRLRCHHGRVTADPVRDLAPVSGLARGAGADLYFERRGRGPALLLIAGGGGDCGYYDALASCLADEFTVISYDRRGNSRSPLHGEPAPIVLAEQSEDALAVLDENQLSTAMVFGNSGGATVALDLAAHHPGRLAAVVAHEPPVPAVLPDAAEYLAFFDDLDELARTDGWQAAFTRFQSVIGGIGPLVIRALLDPARYMPPVPARGVMLRVAGNWEYMITYEVRSFIDYQPALEMIRASATPIAFGRGTSSADPAMVRMSEVCAAQLGAECVVFPGGHTGPMERPGPFAGTLRALLGRLSEPAS